MHVSYQQQLEPTRTFAHSARLSERDGQGVCSSLMRASKFTSV